MKKKNGFSLVQVLIAAGMLSGIFVVSLKMLKNQSQVGRSSSEEFELSYAFDDMRNLLSNPDVCASTLELINAYEPVELEGIRNKELDDGYDYQPFHISGKKYGQNNLKIKSLQYTVGTQEASVEDGEGFIKVVFEKSRSALGETIVEKKIKIHLMLDDKNNISSCYALAGMNISNDTGTPRKGKVKVWHNVAGTQKIYTNKNNVKINTHRGSRSMGLSFKGKLQLVKSFTKCSTEKKGSIRFSNNALELCSKNGSWRKVINPTGETLLKEYLLTSDKENKVIVTKFPFSFCSITESNLYGASCKSKRLNDNLWNLSLMYDRGASSTCHFTCYR